jgi:transcriptional regulator with XRE-family HTH domain
MVMYSPLVVRLPRLRWWRERRAMTQQELAEKAGITRAALSRIESGQAEPRPPTVRRLAAALRVEPDQLMAPLSDEA